MPGREKLKAIGFTLKDADGKFDDAERIAADDAKDYRAVGAAWLEGASQPVDEIVCLNGAMPLDPRHRSKVDYSRLRAKLRAELADKSHDRPRASRTGREAE